MSFHKTYETDVSEVRVRGRAFRLFRPRYIEPFIDEGDPLRDFPLWSKIWEASLVLADFLAGMPPESGRRFLEIGGGSGLVSIVAASFGHDITLTEHNPHALEFARANARANGCPELKVLELDWNRPSKERTFDFIVGSEVVYHERDFEPLERLFDALLNQEGEIILAEGIRKTSMDFFARMQQSFQVKGHRKVLRSGGKEVPVILCRMRRLE
ncbi:MAG: methyltransferase [Thermodesulfobacteriota bacterium]